MIDRCQIGTELVVVRVVERLDQLLAVLVEALE